ncbi:MAG TPA: galactokinase family protein [Vicinamibacterales bacterium]|nr:galactokinase family protein [Vicinamibacterales bacterium]
MTAPRDRLRDRAVARLRADRGGAGDVRVWHVPGRIEVLGKHTDYAGGRSLLCTVDRGLVVAVAAREDAMVAVRDASAADPVRASLDEVAPAVRGGWAVYLDAVTSRLARNFGPDLRGADLVVESDLPRAAGLSSSSALVTGLFTALADRNALDAREAYRQNIRSVEDLAGYVSAIEAGAAFGSLAGNAGVGTMSGSEDHTAILCCQPDWLSRYAFCPVRAEGRVGFPDECAFAVGVSGVVAVKTADARDHYNRAATAAATVLRLWCDATGRSDPSLAIAATSAPDAAERIREVLRRARLPPTFTARQLLDRFEQFFQESERIVPAAFDALARHDFARFGDEVDRSQRGVEQWLGNQVPETIFLARAAREAGALAASAFGAGFGGSVWAMVPRAHDASFLDDWRRRYAAAFPHRRPDFFLTRPSAPLRRL